MTTTQHLGMTLVEQAQAQKEVTVNAALIRVDAILNTGAVDKDLNTPPGSPAAGAVYIVGPSPTGDWSGEAGNVAYFDQVWKFITPNEGLSLWVNDEDLLYSYNGSSWGPYADVTLSRVNASEVRSASINMADNLLIRPQLLDVSYTCVTQNSGTNYTIDCEYGNVFVITLTGNCTFTFSNPPATGKGGSLMLVLKQDGTGGRTTTWPGTVKWPGGTPPSLASTANAVSLMTFLTTNAGSAWYGISHGTNFS